MKRVTTMTSIFNEVETFNGFVHGDSVRYSSTSSKSLLWDQSLLMPGRGPEEI